MNNSGTLKSIDDLILVQLDYFHQVPMIYNIELNILVFGIYPVEVKY